MSEKPKNRSDRQACEAVKNSISKRQKKAKKTKKIKMIGEFQESNQGPLAPKARIIPLDQTPTSWWIVAYCRTAIDSRGITTLVLLSLSFHGIHIRVNVTKSQMQPFYHTRTQPVFALPSSFITQSCCFYFNIALFVGVDHLLSLAVRSLISLCFRLQAICSISFGGHTIATQCTRASACWAARKGSYFTQFFCSSRISSWSTHLRMSTSFLWTCKARGEPCFSCLFLMTRLCST